MNQTYKEKLITALNKTISLGLNVDSKIIPFRKKLSDRKRHKIANAGFSALKSAGFNRSSELAGHCIRVHLYLKEVLRNELGVNSELCIGERRWPGYTYCAMSYEMIKSELRQPDIHKPLKAHVWLTLSDGSIYDFTGEAHADLLFERGEHPLEQCLVFIPPDRELPVAQGAYFPLLVGADFLYKVGAIPQNFRYR